MTEPTPNIALLDETLAYIEAHPEEHRQDVWWCGTAGCFAGHVALSQGGVLVDVDLEGFAWLVKAESDDPPERLEGRVSVDVVSIYCRAQRLLGLTWGEAAQLFSHRNTLDDLRRFVAEIKARAAR
jgi:hypothetical protein